jgi:hypothetical protein
MTPAHRLAYLIVLAVAVLVMSVVVIVRDRSLDDELLAVIGLCGGVAIVVTALPAGNGNNHH